MANNIHDSQESNSEITSKRRKGFPSETRVKRGVRIVHGIKELREKLGRNDPCPCAIIKVMQRTFNPLNRERYPGGPPIQ